jgi:ATP-binding cassette subfamily C protein
MKAAFLWLAMRQVGFTMAMVTLDLRLQLVRSVLKARWSYFGKQQVGGFANSLTGEAVRSSAAYREACVVLGGLVQVVIYLVISALISWQVTVVALVTGVALTGSLKRFIAMGRAAGQQQTSQTMSLARSVVDAMQGIKPMKAMAREDLVWPLLERQAEALNQAQRRGVIASESLRLLQEPVVTLVLGVGLVVLLTAANTTFSAVIVLAFIFYRLMNHINTLQMRYQVMVTGESAFWSLRGHIDEAIAAEEVHLGTIRVDGLRDTIELRDVSFAYADLQVLDRMSVTVRAGSITALIGESGSGKTTILDLITGLQRPSQGEVYIDGVPLASIDLKAWRQLVGYVPQDVFLFHDTVRRNITLGDETISDARVAQALKDAGAWDFIARDAAGIDAIIAPQGSNLSGGQRQRLAIARALAKAPALIILDEATTGLDTRTEAAILETLSALRGKVTILAISHQPALRNTADVTINLERGKIVREEGPALVAGGGA